MNRYFLVIVSTSLLLFLAIDRDTYHKVPVISACYADSDCVRAPSGGNCGSVTCVTKGQYELGDYPHYKSIYGGQLSCSSPANGCRCMSNQCKSVYFYEPRDAIDCSFGKELGQFEYCYHKIAQNRSNQSLCDKIPSLRSQIICKYSIALESGNISNCNRTGLQKDICIFNIINKNGSIKLHKGFYYLNHSEMNLSYFLGNNSKSTILFFINSDYHGAETYFGQSTDNFRPNEFSRRMVFRNGKLYFHLADHHGVRFKTGSMPSSDVEKQLDILGGNTEYASYLGPMYDSLWGVVLINGNHSAGQTITSLFMYKHLYKILNMREPRLPHYDIEPRKFCYQMYNFSYYIGSFDIIAFYRDQCLYDVAMESDKNSVCVDIEDGDIRHICYENFYMRDIGYQFQHYPFRQFRKQNITWRAFNNTCADWCNSAQICANFSTWSADCDNKCWNGTDCVNSINMVI